ncbi:MAG TPA: hypothetical protein VIZ65_17705 [Cellvibrionaceae bacterium]
MAETTALFDLVLTGQLAQGVERSQVIAQLALLFKMPAEKIAGLMDNAPVVLKKELAWDLAKRYRVAIKQAGALSDIRPSETKIETKAETKTETFTRASVIPEVCSSKPVENPPVVQVTTRDWSLADVGADVLTEEERIPVTSRLHEYTDFSLRASEGNLLDTAEQSPLIVAPAHLGEELDLAPPGSEVLALHERALPVAALVESPEYEVARLGERLSDPARDKAQAPDISHLTLVQNK